MILIETFGYKQPKGAPLDAHVSFSLAHVFRDPLDTELREMTGLDAPIIKRVRESNNYVQHLHVAVATVLGFHSLYGDIKVAVGCGGGRHRSVVFGNDLYEQIAISSIIPVTLTHRDVKLPVIKP